MMGNKVAKVVDDTANADIRCSAIFTIVGCQFSSGVHVLLGTNDHREAHHEEDDRRTTEPDHHVDGELLSPSHAHILARYPPDNADQEVGHEPGEGVHHEDPSLTTSRDRENFDLLHLVISRFLINDVVLLQTVKHVASNARWSLGTSVDVLATEVVASLVVVELATGCRQQTSTGIPVRPACIRSEEIVV